MKALKDSSLSPQTFRIIIAALDADPGLAPAHRRTILDACSNPSPARQPPDGKLYTATEAAALFGVTLPGVLKWIRAGKLEAQRVGKRGFLISSVAVDAMLASRNAKSAPVATLPDRLAHLSPAIQGPKPSKKSMSG